MTGGQWKLSKRPVDMLEGLTALESTVSERKLRLFACGCTYELGEHEFVADVEVAGRYADGTATAEEMVAASYNIEHAEEEFNPVSACAATCLINPWAAARGASFHVVSYQGYTHEDFLLSPSIEQKCAELGRRLARREAESIYGSRKKKESRIRSTQADLLRCIFGNPFRPVPFDPVWRTPTLVGLAAGIYTDRAWDRMPVLGDALDDAGCPDPRVLDHCRYYQVHARGCWVVDAILGK